LITKFSPCWFRGSHQILRMGNTMGFFKKIIFLGLLGAVGWGMYQAGEKHLFSFFSDNSEKNTQLVKKDHAVKSESIFKKIKNVVPAPVKQYDYTFFETLEDVDLDRYVDLDGKVKVMKKTVHSWVNEVEKVIQEPRIILASYKEPDGDNENPSSSSYKDILNQLDDLMEEEPRKKSPEPSAIAPNTPKQEISPRITSGSARRTAPSSLSLGPYMVQVSSFKKLSQARSLESKLKAKGFPAFVRSVEISKTKGVWYRVFLGKYQNEANARAAADQAQRLHNLKGIVLKEAK